MSQNCEKETMQFSVYIVTMNIQYVHHSL